MPLVIGQQLVVLTNQVRSSRDGAWPQPGLNVLETDKWSVAREGSHGGFLLSTYLGIVEERVLVFFPVLLCRAHRLGDTSLRS